MRPKVTVVVPVYKVEKYLNRCIETIVNQTMKEIEIILIDDGSPDKCGQMCDDWEKRDNRIKVVHKENEGLGLARNSGLGVATGEYVSFVDSDDYIATDAYQNLYPIMKSTNADLCYFGYVLVKDNGKTLKKIPDFKRVYVAQEIKDELLMRTFGGTFQREDDEYRICSVWKALYSLDFLNGNGLLFCSEKEWLCEDLFFNLHVFYYAQKVVVTDYAPYYYCQNHGSLTQSYLTDRFEKSNKMYARMLEIASQMGLGYEAQMRATTTYLINVLVCLKQELDFTNRHNIAQIYKNIKKLCNSATLKEVLSLYPTSKMPVKQKILFACMRQKRILLVILLVLLRQFIDHLY